MLESRSQIADVIAHYARALYRQGFAALRIYMFGSHLHGTAHELSDVDVVVVSPFFRGKPFWERAEYTGRARVETFQATGESVEALAKTPEEVASAHPASFLADILKDAVVVYEDEAA